MGEGKRLKEVKSHIKTEVLVVTKGEIIIPIAIKLGRAYSDERKLFKQMLIDVSLEEGSYIIGNRLYGMDRQLAKLFDGIRNSIRDTYRKRLK